MILRLLLSGTFVKWHYRKYSEVGYIIMSSQTCYEYRCTMGGTSVRGYVWADDLDTATARAREAVTWLTRGDWTNLTVQSAL